MLANYNVKHPDLSIISNVSKSLYGGINYRGLYNQINIAFLFTNNEGFSTNYHPKIVQITESNLTKGPPTND